MLYELCRSIGHGTLARRCLMRSVVASGPSVRGWLSRSLREPEATPGEGFDRTSACKKNPIRRQADKPVSTAWLPPERGAAVRIWMGLVPRMLDDILRSGAKRAGPAIRQIAVLRQAGISSFCCCFQTGRVHLDSGTVESSNSRCRRRGHAACREKRPAQRRRSALRPLPPSAQAGENPSRWLTQAITHAPTRVFLSLSIPTHAPINLLVPGATCPMTLSARHGLPNLQ